MLRQGIDARRLPITPVIFPQQTFWLNEYPIRIKLTKFDEAYACGGSVDIRGSLHLPSLLKQGRIVCNYGRDLTGHGP